MNVLEFYKTGGNPEWLPMVRQRFRQHYRDWTALLHTIYYDEKQKVGREKMREIVNTMKQMAYILDVSAQKLSNIYHGLVKPKGLAKYVIIYHV